MMLWSTMADTLLGRNVDVLSNSICSMPCRCPS
jgi:hypothetical protein